MGDIYALLTAFCWSVAVILFDLSSNKLNPLQINIVKNSIGVIGFILTIIILSIPFPSFSKTDFVILIISGMIGVGVADLFFLNSLKKIGSSLTAIVGTIYAPSVFIIAYIWFNESITLNLFIGSFLIIGGISAYMNKDNKQNVIVFSQPEYASQPQFVQQQPVQQQVVQLPVQEVVVPPHQISAQQTPHPPPGILANSGVSDGNEWLKHDEQIYYREIGSSSEWTKYQG